jgi:hypothetical protein
MKMMMIGSVIPDETRHHQCHSDTTMRGPTLAEVKIRRVLSQTLKIVSPTT